MSLIRDAKLDIIATRNSQYPLGDKPEFLLVGRSNVGKSSFINTILSRKNLAHTSSNPGKTQTLNFYLVNDSFYLVDVPGYGYAAVDKKMQAKFGKMIEEYLETRDNLKRVFLLVDFRRVPTDDDVLMYNFLKYYNVPVTVVFTKADKTSIRTRQNILNESLKKLDLVLGDDAVIFSSVTKLGSKEVISKIDSVLSDVSAI